MNFLITPSKIIFYSYNIIKNVKAGIGGKVNSMKAKDNMLKVIERVEKDLREIELISSDYLVKERIHNILDFIEKETKENKTVLEDMIRSKIKETKNINPELNTYFYVLYRNLSEDKITVEEAQTIYDMYIKELRVY
jgi:hypothetical protein